MMATALEQLDNVLHAVRVDKYTKEQLHDIEYQIHDMSFSECLHGIQLIRNAEEVKSSIFYAYEEILIRMRQMMFLNLNLYVFGGKKGSV